MGDAERSFSDAELDRAVAALSEPDRFRAAEARVARAAPALAQVLDEAQRAGGWLGEAQAQQVRAAPATTTPPPAWRRSARC